MSENNVWTTTPEGGWNKVSILTRAIEILESTASWPIATQRLFWLFGNAAHVQYLCGQTYVFHIANKLIQWDTSLSTAAFAESLRHDLVEARTESSFDEIIAELQKLGEDDAVNLLLGKPSKFDAEIAELRKRLLSHSDWPDWLPPKDFRYPRMYHVDHTMPFGHRNSATAKRYDDGSPIPRNRR